MQKKIAWVAFIISVLTSLLMVVLTIKKTTDSVSEKSLSRSIEIHPVKSCENMQTSIKIVDESGGRDLSGASVATLQKSPFKNYVTTVSQHVFAKIGEMTQCHGNLQSPPEVKLFFVYRPLIAAGIAPFDLEAKKSSGNRYLDSPWSKLTISNSPKLHVQGVFVWSERQFLLDQALLSGARASPTKLLLPIDEKVFGKFVQDYTNSVLLAESPEAKTAAQSSISNRLPVEILWLLRHAWQSTMAPFSMEVDYALVTTIEKAEIGYIDLTNTIFGQFLDSTKTEAHYESVLSLNNVFTLDKYRLNQLH